MRRFKVMSYLAALTGSAFVFGACGNFGLGDYSLGLDNWTRIITAILHKGLLF
jgi:hypothetical protein